MNCRCSLLFASIGSFLLTLCRLALAQNNYWQQSNGPYGGPVLSLAISASGHIFAACDTGGVYRSTDGGSSWTQSGLATLRISSAAVNALGYVFAGCSPVDPHDSTRGVYRSTDDGQNWTQVLSPDYYGGVCCLAINDSGYIIAGDPEWGVYRSTDHGESWTYVLDGFGYAARVLALAASSNNHFFAGANDGFYRSTNNGETWERRGFAYYYVAPIAANSNGLVFAFVYAYPLPSNGLNRSTNEGLTWTLAGSPAGSIHALSVTASGYVFAGTSNGVFRSTDNGNSWMQINAGLTDTVVECLFLNSDGYIFAGTQSGRVFRSTQSTIVSVEQRGRELPEAFSLEQNYPNPFNPSTKISFKLQVSGFTSLKVYDVLGREVRTLVNEELKPGSYETTFDGSGFASGTYFYRLQAGEFMQTKRLLLLR